HGPLHPQPAHARQPLAARAGGADQRLEPLPQPDRARPARAVRPRAALDRPGPQPLGRDAAHPGRPDGERFDGPRPGDGRVGRTRRPRPHRSAEGSVAGGLPQLPRRQHVAAHPAPPQAPLSEAPSSTPSVHAGLSPRARLGTCHTSAARDTTRCTNDQPPLAGGGRSSRTSSTTCWTPGSPSVPLWNAGTTTVGSSGLTSNRAATASATGSTTTCLTPGGRQERNERMAGASASMDRNNGFDGEIFTGPSPPIAPLRASSPSPPTMPQLSVPAGG